MSSLPRVSLCDARGVFCSSPVSSGLLWASQRTLADIEESFFGIFANFPSAPLALAMRAVAFPTGRCYAPPSDKLSQEVAQLISTDSEARRTVEES